MTVHLCYPPIKGCKNPDTYGEICVQCNKCHRFNPNWTCLNCGKRTRAMVSRKTWQAVELYDVFRAPICPNCQPLFTKEERGIADLAFPYPETIPVHKKDFVRRE